MISDQKERILGFKDVTNEEWKATPYLYVETLLELLDEVEEVGDGHIITKPVRIFGVIDKVIDIQLSTLSTTC